MALKFPVSLIGKRVSNWLGFGNSSRLFDGVDDHVSLPASVYQAFSDTDDFSIACWCKPDPSISASSMMIGFLGDDVSSRPQISMFCKSDGAFGVSVREFATSNTNNVTTSGNDYRGAWHHVVMTYRGSDSRVQLFVDGSSIGTSTTFNLSFAGTDFDEGNIGASGATLLGYDGFFNGLVADVRIYDVIVADLDITALSNGTDYQTNLFGHWLKDTDDVIDHSANTNDGDNAFEPEYSTDSPNKNYATSGQASRSFNGVNDYIDCGDNDIFSFNNNPATNTDNPFSVSAWIKMNNAAKFRILSKWDNNGVNETEWTLTTDSLNQLNFLLGERSSAARIVRQYTGTLMTTYVGQWIHVVGTYDGRGGSTADQGINLYVNNVQVDDNSNNAGSYVAMENTVTPVEIGSLTTTVERDYADGLIADVRLYSDELTAGEVTNLYNGTDHTDNLVGHWLGNSNDLLDMSVNNNNGTHEGAQYSTDGPAS